MEKEQKHMLIENVRPVVRFKQVTETREKGRKGDVVKTSAVYSKKSDKVVAVLVALLDAQGKISIGFSKWCKTVDVYNRERGHSIAVNRAKTDSGENLPLSLKKRMAKFVKRARKYYKDADLNERSKFVLTKFGVNITTKK